MVGYIIAVVAAVAFVGTVVAARRSYKRFTQQLKAGNIVAFKIAPPTTDNPPRAFTPPTAPARPTVMRYERDVVSFDNYNPKPIDGPTSVVTNTTATPYVDPYSEVYRTPAPTFDVETHHVAPTHHDASSYSHDSGSSYGGDSYGGSSDGGSSFDAGSSSCDSGSY